ncbi:hypothetical protein [Actinoplanes derwentensis]|uniref:Uncharacterized protein n=1 Tax=Actinoplanes derwentensis TaxID=113562 RepID=A0A1H1ZEU8_9ACTN|nr:hypothetical protein [Actinoplanes derwentensis]GID82405.1 hypothetical protein Ade03nite_13290 [Actinoplanes derwentensis]SDT32244.1 hypothetical protein SAMN04489716_3287 [Actinoplanes derwentensis]
MTRTAWWRRVLTAPFTWASVACLILAGWSLWTGGVFEGPIARQVRTSSVYAVPSVGLDVAAAERIIGNRRLIVVFAEPDTPDPGLICDALDRAADGTMVMVLRSQPDGWKRYGCAMFDGGGELMAMEGTLGVGIQQFGDDPLATIKVVVVNYDRIVRAGYLSDGPRTISPYLPRYLMAGAAVLAVLFGSLLIWLGGRRAGRVAMDRRERRDSATDGRVAVSAAAAVVAQQIIDLDSRYRHGDDNFRRRYVTLAGDYADLLGDLETVDDGRAAQRVEKLLDRARHLSRRR